MWVVHTADNIVIIISIIIIYCSRLFKTHYCRVEVRGWMFLGGLIYPLCCCQTHESKTQHTLLLRFGPTNPECFLVNKPQGEAEGLFGSSL